ncbi:hypothetical protein DYH09_01135 [bacterium CPR1]|nr:hypothetical protein [bacterium CPR1]
MPPPALPAAPAPPAPPALPAFPAAPAPPPPRAFSMLLLRSRAPTAPMARSYLAASCTDLPPSTSRPFWP